MKILIADDHQLFRVAFIRLLKNIYANCDFYEAANGKETLERLKVLKFDLVFLDVSMPIMDGYEACKFIRQDHPALSIIMLTQFDDHHLIQHFFKMGVHSFLTKDACISDLTSAIDYALRGDFFFPEQIKLIIKNLKGKEDQCRLELAPQEKKLIRLLHKGIAIKEVAQQMGLTEKSARTYRERLMKKTKTNNVAQLISFGFKKGILSL